MTITNEEIENLKHNLEEWKRTSTMQIANIKKISKVLDAQNSKLSNIETKKERK
jgi:hypothetical protein